MSERSLDEFQAELQRVINKHCVDSMLSIPDFILAHYLVRNIASLYSLRVDETDWRRL